MNAGIDGGFAGAIGVLLTLLGVPAQAQAPAVESSSPLSPEIDEIVVTAQWGAALVESETELGEAEIDAYGANSIGDLVSLIAPLTGRPDERPIILINGERADGATGINGFPPEALARIAILRSEAAERYGYPPGQRVVNLVLKKSFASWQGEAGVQIATAGGRESGQLSLGRFVIDGKSRWSARIDASHDNHLLKSARSGAGDLDASDASRTLLPASDRLTMNLGLTRPLGRFSGTFGIDVARRDTRQLLGPAPVPAGGGGDPLRGDQDSTNLGLSALLGGPLAGWQSNIIARYTRSWSTNALERVAAGPEIRIDRTRSRSEGLSAQVNLNRPVLTLPAGMVTSNISFGAARDWTQSRGSGEGDIPAGFEFRRRQWDARLSLGVPISSSVSDRFSALGDLSVDIAGGVSEASGSPLQERFDFGLNWTPFPLLQLTATAGFAQLIPSADQLGGPYVEEVRRIYDYRRQEIAEPRWITGGNPDLGRGRQRSYSLRASLTPFADPQISITSQYQRQSATGGAGLFPTLTPAVEDAFPERVVRDAAGRLVSVDARPIRIARDISERLDSGLVVSFSTGGRAGAEVGAPPQASPWQVTLSINHGWTLRSELLTRPGVPAIDRLRGDTAQSRHSLTFQLVAGRAGAGLTLDGTWQSPFRLRVDGQQDYRHRAVTALNLRLFAEPERLLRMQEKPAWLADLNIALDIRNLFDSYRRVVLSDGTVPAGYERYEVDPLGRTVQLSLRKRF
ncbi:hypothetical protein [Sphingopyxis chilensis]